MNILFVATDETGIAAALRLAKHGFKTGFYSPSPYVQSKAENYDIQFHRPVRKTEFLKLRTENRFDVVSDIQEKVDEVWIHFNTFRDGKDEYHAAENIVKKVAEKIIETKIIVFCGITKVGEANRLIGHFFDRFKGVAAQHAYVGGPSLHDSCLPAWTTSEVCSSAFLKLEPIYFSKPEEAEAATLSILFSRLAAAEAMVEVATQFGSVQTISNCIKDDLLLHPEYIDAIKFFKTYNMPPFLSNLFSKVRRTVAKREKQALNEIYAYVKRSRKSLRILFVAPSEAFVKKFESRFGGRGVKFVFVPEHDILAADADSFGGFDGVLLNSLRLDLLREFSKRYEKIWFVPAL